MKARHGGGHAAGPIRLRETHRPYGDHDIPDPRRFRGPPQRKPRRRKRNLRRQGGQGHRHRDRERHGGDRRRPEVAKAACRCASSPRRARRPSSRSATRSKSMSTGSRTAHGEAMLSRDRARREAAWDKLEKEFEAGNRVEGVIFGRVKGGFTVDLGGAVAFLPGQPGRHPPGPRRRAADGPAAAVPDPQDGPPPRQHRRVAPRDPRRNPRRAAQRASSRASPRAR